MTVRELQEKILELKKATNTAILAHSYQAREIVEIADYTGDSYKLSVDASKTDAENILFCGVHFMAETAKMLSPQKRVFLANKSAGCPMAEQMDKELISQLREKDPDRTVVAYINTTASLKTVCDVCVTSSSALRIVKALDTDKILFIPDCNLGNWVKKQVTATLETGSKSKYLKRIYSCSTADVPLMRLSRCRRLKKLSSNTLMHYSLFTPNVYQQSLSLPIM